MLIILLVEHIFIQRRRSWHRQQLLLRPGNEGAVRLLLYLFNYIYLLNQSLRDQYVQMRVIALHIYSRGWLVRLVNEEQ